MRDREAVIYKDPLRRLEAQMLHAAQAEDFEEAAKVCMYVCHVCMHVYLWRSKVQMLHAAQAEDFEEAAKVCMYVMYVYMHVFIYIA